MSIMDSQIVNVAVASLGRDFSAAPAQVQWVITGYLLSIAASIPLSGWLGDRLVFTALYVQEGRGGSALTSGLTTFPEAVAIGLSSQVVARLYPRACLRPLIAAGFLSGLVAVLAAGSGDRVRVPVSAFHAVYLAGAGVALIGLLLALTIRDAELRCREHDGRAGRTRSLAGLAGDAAVAGAC